MQRLEVSGAVRPIYGSLGVKGLKHFQKCQTHTDGFGLGVDPVGTSCKTFCVKL